MFSYRCPPVTRPSVACALRTPSQSPALLLILLPLLAAPRPVAGVLPNRNRPPAPDCADVGVDDEASCRALCDARDGSDRLGGKFLADWGGHWNEELPNAAGGHTSICRCSAGHAGPYGCVVVTPLTGYPTSDSGGEDNLTTSIPTFSSTTSLPTMSVETSCIYTYLSQELNFTGNSFTYTLKQSSLSQTDGSNINQLGIFTSYDNVTGIAQFDGGTWCGVVEDYRRATVKFIEDCSAVLAMTSATETSTCVYDFEVTGACFQAGCTLPPTASPAGNTTTEYAMVTSGNCDTPVTSLEQCSEGAAALGFSNTTAENNDGAAWMPPHCARIWSGAGYYYLNFDAAGTNRGVCDEVNACVCLVTSASPSSASTTFPSIGIGEP